MALAGEGEAWPLATKALLLTVVRRAETRTGRPFLAARTDASRQPQPCQRHCYHLPVPRKMLGYASLLSLAPPMMVVMMVMHTRPTAQSAPESARDSVSLPIPTYSQV